MKLTVELNLDNDAFQDCHEIGRILSHTAEYLTRYGWTHRPFRDNDTGPLFDVNGNKVGHWAFTDEVTDD